MTGFLLAGVGSVDLRKTTNFLVVNDSESAAICLHLHETSSRMLRVLLDSRVLALSDAFSTQPIPEHLQSPQRPQ